MNDKTGTTTIETMCELKHLFDIFTDLHSTNYTVSQKDDLIKVKVHQIFP